MFTHRTDSTFSHKARLAGVFQSFFRLSLVLLILTFSVSVFEIIYNGFIHGFPDSSARVLAVTGYNDLLFFLKLDFILFWPYLLIYYISKKAAGIVYSSIAAIFLLIQLGLSFYFLSAFVPLGADVFGYSSAEIQQTVGASGSLNLLSILSFVVLISLILLAFRFLFRKMNLSFFAALALPVVSLILWCLPGTWLQLNIHFKNDFVNSLVLNKTSFFIGESYEHFFPPEDDVDIYADAFIGIYSDSNAKNIWKFNYVDESQYPFLHNRDTADVLSAFFRKDTVKPNIVLLIVEGLGRAFCNDGAYLGNFTPFIDSLANESLYWNNFLSEGGRTFAVLPSVLGSLPFGKNGFCEMADNMPHQLSLMSLLKYNGYRTSYFYGGNSKFDYMNTFLKKQGVDEINDINTFGSGYEKMPQSSSGFSWGYGDKELFRYYFNTINKNPQQPRLNVLMTLSTHSPFLVNDEDKYLAEFEQRMNELHFTESEKDQHRNYKLQYATIMFMDDAVRWFFSQYKSRPDFQNTIFIITGDHRMPEIPMATKIDRYHVPLIVYSPLLNRTAEFHSVSTHFDITPSLIAFLAKQYKIKVPSRVSWMGTGLDTMRSFRNVHAYPLMQTKSDIIDFISGDWMLHNQELYKITPDMGLIPATDPQQKSQMTASFNRFLDKNGLFIKGAPLVVDTTYRKFFPL